MKRYRLSGYSYNSKLKRMEMIEHCMGEWVKADIAEELYEVVSELSCYKDSPVPNTLIDLAEKVKNKARGESE